MGLRIPVSKPSKSWTSSTARVGTKREERKEDLLAMYWIDQVGVESFAFFLARKKLNAATATAMITKTPSTITNAA